MAEARLSIADQLVANALIYLAARVVEDRDRDGLMIEALRLALPQTSGHPVIAPMVAAARVLLGALDEVPRSQAAISAARLHAAGPVANFVFWRAALAHAALTDGAAA
jgi:hypothetical protein